MPMSISYDVFTGAFLSKVIEFDFATMTDLDRQETVDGYMKRAIAEFKHICKYDLTTTANDETREFDVEILVEDLDEITDIISEGMILQWIKPFMYRQEIFENAISTKDFSTFSPAVLLYRMRETYNATVKYYNQAMREYSYNHGDLGSLHL